MSRILHAIQDALSEVLEEHVSDLSPTANLLSDFDLDSVMFVQFLLALEEKIPGLIFTPDSIGQSSFNQVDKLVAHIESNCGAE